MTHSIKNIADFCNITPSRVRQFCKAKKVEKTSGSYIFNLYEWSKILPLKYKHLLDDVSNIPEVIYVTRTIEIYQSKMNF